MATMSFRPTHNDGFAVKGAPRKLKPHLESQSKSVWVVWGPPLRARIQVKPFQEIFFPEYPRGGSPDARISGKVGYLRDKTQWVK